MATRMTAGALKAPFERQRIAKLHHGGPDVIEKLNFSDGLEPASGHADGPAHDAGLRKRRIEDAVGSISALESGRGLENAALPFHLLEILLAAGIGNILAEGENALIAGHFIHERCRHHLDHGLLRAVKLRLRLKGG